MVKRDGLMVPSLLWRMGVSPTPSHNLATDDTRGGVRVGWPSDPHPSVLGGLTLHLSDSTMRGLRLVLTRETGP